YENMEIIANAINAMYDLNLTREDVIKTGIEIIKSEIEFNEKAGITQEMNDIPKFFREEPSHPTGLKYSFDKAELSNFWKRLDEYDF
ncbi:MAG: hypothetical protein KAW51_03415, partial [Candidatus Lokiarchaeota archaeon]|nr:hypothetical protein [Candidatus Lokiarchaeota archaeon]